MFKILYFIIFLVISIGMGFYMYYMCGGDMDYDIHDFSVKVGIGFGIGMFVVSMIGLYFIPNI